MKVKFNISQIHVALKQEKGPAKYDIPFEVPGAVAMTLDPKGDKLVFYADGVEYYTENTNMGYDGSLEAALFNDEFREKVLKEVLDSKKVMLEMKNAETVDAAVGVQVDGDGGKSVRLWFYNCNFSRPKFTAKTNTEKKEVETEEINMTVKGEKIIEGKEDIIIRSKTTDATDSKEYESWFTKVYIPTMSLPA